MLNYGFLFFLCFYKQIKENLKQKFSEYELEKEAKSNQKPENQITIQGKKLSKPTKMSKGVIMMIFFGFLILLCYKYKNKLVLKHILEKTRNLFKLIMGFN